MFEGSDGVGKTTQIELTQKALEAAGWPVLSTRNLGGTPIGEALREVLLSPVERPAMTDFYVSLAIQEPLLDLIDATRKEGKIVLMDRGPLSLAAYQVFGAGVDETTGWRHVEAGMDRIRPEAVILYDMDVQQAMERKRQRASADYFESKPADYFQRVAEGYRTAAGRYDATVIDAAQSAEVIQEQTIAIISGLLATEA